ncbi:MAG: hypothetical protein PVF58_09315 [Candidatus Methanofastidiosia archaeon]|jgi:hypothetical protein
MKDRTPVKRGHARGGTIMTWRYTQVSGQGQLPADKADPKESEYIGNGPDIFYSVTAYNVTVSFEENKVTLLTPTISYMRYGGITSKDQPLIARFKNLPT